MAKTLARNGLAFRGNDDDENGNFRQIVYLLARHNSVMKSWLDGRDFRKHKTTYLSPRSQTEYVSLLGEEMRKEISNRVKKASFCSVMADTTPDVNHSDELSVALRFINTDTFEPEERLVRIMETKDKTGLGSANNIIKCLNLSDIPLEEVMFQTYDSAANMCGKFNGAQRKINDLLGREIPYTKCTPHGVVERCFKASLLIGKVFAVIERIFLIFKRNAFLREHTKDVENCLKLKNLSKTRWSAKAESVKAVWRSLEAIICALDGVKESDQKEAKLRASALLNDIVSIDFVCGLMFLKNIMPQTKTLSDYLQRKSVNVASALVVLNSTQDCLKRMRSEDKNFNNQIESAVIVAKYLGTDPIADFARLHKNRRRPEA